MTAAARYVLGLDGGYTGALGLLASESGTIVAEARAAGASLQTHGEHQVEALLAEVVDELGGLEPLSAVCIGLAGIERPQDETVVRNILKRLGYRERAQVVNNAVVALVAGSAERVGIALLAGMGAIAYGIDRSGRTARAGGLGPLLSDEGSNYWLGCAALRAAVRGSDGRGPQTALTPMVFSSFGAASALELLPVAYERGLSRLQIAALAAAVQKAAERGDAVAEQLLESAAGELACAARAVAERLEFDAPYPLVMAGSAFAACPDLVARVSRRLELPLARPARLEVEAATGAVTLALELLRA